MKTHVVSCQGRMHGAASGVQKMSKMAISFVVDTSNATKNASSTASLFVPHSLNAAEWFSRPLLQQLGGKEARELEGWRAQCLDVGGIVTMANKVGEPSVSPTSSTVSTSSLSSTDRPFVCLLCGKAFAKGRYLTQHRFVHSAVKPHVCEVCGSGFKRACELQLHNSVHTNAKPYQCALCFASFKSSQNLKQHGQTHSEERPHVCPECGSAFKRGSTLKRHRIQEHY